MPELPEVESVVLSLLPDVQGRTVERIIIHRDELRRKIREDRWSASVLHQKILGTRRRAKWPALVFQEGCLWMHLGMTGQIQLLPSDQPVGPHDHMDLVLDNGKILRYFDPRRFGIIDWTLGQASEPPSGTLGPEPLEAGFTMNDFYTALQKSNKAIKPLLMDGKAVVGVGNIYASEALFKAGIHPSAPAKKLKQVQINMLHSAIVEVLSAAVANGGSTLRDYRKPDGSSGNAQNYHQVYDRAYSSCNTCGCPIQTMVQASRATYWCATCQPWKTIYA